MKTTTALAWRTGRHELLLASMLLMSPAAGILLHYANVMSLRASLLLFAPLAIVAGGLLVRRASRSPTARLALYGLLGGLAATLAYDATRMILLWMGVVSQPFRSIELYGLLILGPGETLQTHWAGWLFHFWNGVSFGMFFALAFGRPTIFKGVVWGLILELALVATSPKLLALTIQGELLASSLLGHVAYGVTLASVVARTRP